MQNNNDQDPNEIRPVDQAAKETVSLLKKEFVFVGKKRIKTWKAMAILAFITGVAVALILAVSFNVETLSEAKTKTKTEKKESQSDSLKKQTLEILTLRKQYDKDSKNKKILDQLVSAAKGRKQTLLNLMEIDPQSVLSLALPKDIKQSFPPKAQDQIEEEVTAEGELEVLNYDFKNNKTEYSYFLKNKDEKVSLYFSGKKPAYLTGSKISVKGIKVDDKLAISKNDKDITLLAYSASGSGSKGGKNPPLPTPLPVSPLGAQKTLVMLVNFQDNPTDKPWTTDQVKSAVFTDDSNFFLENSFGQTWLEGDVAGWYTIPVSSTICDINAIASQARTSATTGGYNLSAYNHYVYIFPRNGCGGLGISTLGGNPSQTWIIGSLNLSVIVHELGHTLGLWHAHAYDCEGNILGASCTIFEYGDFFDTMGNTYPGHYNAFEKERLGWLNAGASPPIKTVSSSGTYTLDTYELNSSSPKALKILKSTDPATGEKTWYYLEYRQATGFDGFIKDYPNVLGGILFHTGSETNADSSNLLDMTPNSGTLNFQDWSDPALAAGKTFNDPSTGISVITNSTNTSGADVSVNFGTPTCVHADPTVSVSPLNQFGAPGQTVNYSLVITNNDSLSCSSSIFNVAPALPDGWSQTPQNLSQSIAPAASATFTLGIASPGSATDEIYSIYEMVTNASQSSNQASVHLLYTVQTPVEVTCTSFTYSDWGACQSDGTQTRTVTSSSPSGCVGGNPILTQTCTFVGTTCTSFTYNRWGTCQPDGTQSRTIKSSLPSGCVGGNPVLTQSCTYSSKGSKR